MAPKPLICAAARSWPGSSGRPGIADARDGGVLGEALRQHARRWPAPAASRTGRLRSPRRARNVSIGPAARTEQGAPCASSAVDALRVGVTTAAPSSTSECPAMNFVAECTTTSAPSASGRCSSGVANVLSTTTRRAGVRARQPRAPRCRRRPSAGWSGVSTHSSAAPRHAVDDRRGVRDVDQSRTAAGRAVARRRGTPASRCTRPRGATTSAPTGSSSSTALIAAMPGREDQRRPALQRAQRSSNADHEGLPSRAYVDVAAGRGYVEAKWTGTFSGPPRPSRHARRPRRGCRDAGPQCRSAGAPPRC